MKKIIFSFSLFVLSTSFSFGQKWDSVASGASYWVNALTVYNGNVIAGGRFTDIGNYIAQWNGTKWSDLGSGIKYSQHYNILTCINSLVTYNGNLFGGGSFDSAGITAASCVAQWNSTTWDSVGKGTNYGTYVGINTIITFDSVLYAGGYFDSVGHTSTKNIAQWNGTKWVSLGSGTNGNVNAMTIYNNHLFIGGQFDTAGGKPANIAEWNGVGWTAVSSGWNINTYSTTINAMAVFNGKLYVGGIFDSIGGIAANNIAAWDGTTWSNLGKGVAPGAAIIGFMGGVDALSIYNANLIVGGGFDSAGGALDYKIARWNGSSWSQLGNGILPYLTLNPSPQNVWVGALCVYNGGLFAGGSFDSAGGIYSPNIAQWTEPLAINEVNNSNENISIYPNPSNGKFTIQSSVVSGQSIVEIYNVLGEKIYSQYSLPNTQYQIDLSKEPSGIYFYRVTTEKGELIGNGKLIVQ